ncbi:MAG: hypothetical protein VX341_07195 [Bdellovibrionota bacterium]|nr:hypothetical protein [Bdellovibrionota bacterium]
MKTFKLLLIILIIQNSYADKCDNKCYVQIAVEFFDARPIEKRFKTEPEIYGANFLNSDSYMSCDFEENKDEQIKTFGNMFLNLNSFDQYNNLIEKHVDLKNCIIEYKQKLPRPTLDFKEDCEDCYFKSDLIKEYLIGLYDGYEPLNRDGDNFNIPNTTQLDYIYNSLLVYYNKVCSFYDNTYSVLITDTPINEDNFDSSDLSHPIHLEINGKSSTVYFYKYESGNDTIINMTVANSFQKPTASSVVSQMMNICQESTEPQVKNQTQPPKSTDK